MDSPPAFRFRVKGFLKDVYGVKPETQSWLSIKKKTAKNKAMPWKIYTERDREDMIPFDLSSKQRGCFV